MAVYSKQPLFVYGWDSFSRCLHRQAIQRRTVALISSSEPHVRVLAATTDVNDKWGNSNVIIEVSSLGTFYTRETNKAMKKPQVVKPDPHSAPRPVPL